jgi:hypothetical protein
MMTYNYKKKNYSRQIKYLQIDIKNANKNLRMNKKMNIQIEFTSKIT